MGKIKTYHLTPQKEINIGKTQLGRVKQICIFSFPVHFNNTTHELVRFKRRFEILKIAFAGHGTRYLRSPRSCFPSVCNAKSVLTF